jgi:hypothetical protein
VGTGDRYIVGFCSRDVGAAVLGEGRARISKWERERAACRNKNDKQWKLIRRCVGGVGREEKALPPKI